MNENDKPVKKMKKKWQIAVKKTQTSEENDKLVKKCENKSQEVTN